MKRLAFSALLAAVVSLAACDSGSPTSAAPSDPSLLMSEPAEPVLPGEPPLEPPTDSTTYPPDTTTSPQPVVEYRIVTGLYRSGGDMKAFTEFQRGYNGYWSRVDTYHISVYCYVNGYQRDGESESNASLVHITWGESYQYGKQITCNHSANYGQYTATTTYQM